MQISRPFDGFVEHSKPVSSTCLISFERTRYSVPATFANERVSLRIYADRLVVVAEGKVICEHQRVIERSHHVRGRTIYDWRHYLAVIQRKPGALRNGAPFLELPDAFKRLQQHLLKHPGGDREMAEILALVLHHDEQAVLCAVEGKSPEVAKVEAPQALTLAKEPRADVDRYDDLRNAEEARHAS